MLAGADDVTATSSTATTAQAAAAPMTDLRRLRWMRGMMGLRVTRHLYGGSVRDSAEELGGGRLHSEAAVGRRHAVAISRPEGRVDLLAGTPAVQCDSPASEELADGWDGRREAGRPCRERTYDTAVHARRSDRPGQEGGPGRSRRRGQPDGHRRGEDYRTGVGDRDGTRGQGDGDGHRIGLDDDVGGWKPAARRAVTGKADLSPAGRLIEDRDGCSGPVGGGREGRAGRPAGR